MKSLSPNLLLTLAVLSAAQEATTATATASTSVFDLEDERATCFQDCYRRYGNLAGCPYGEDMFLACWCAEKDWVDREEDCVWDVCGVDAYNSEF